MKDIKRLTKRCRRLIWGIVVLWLMAIPLLWFSPKSVILAAWGVLIGHHNVLISLTVTTRFVGILISLLPFSVILYSAWLLTRLFKHYEQNELFSLENAKLVRKLGFTLYLWAISNIVFKTLLSLLLTLNNPPQYRLLTINISGMDIQSAVIGSIVLLLSWVMLEAQKLDEDNKLIP